MRRVHHLRTSAYVAHLMMWIAAVATAALMLPERTSSTYTTGLIAVGLTLLLLEIVAVIFLVVSYRAVRGYVKSGDAIRVDDFVRQTYRKAIGKGIVYSNTDELFRLQQLHDAATHSWTTKIA